MCVQSTAYQPTSLFLHALEVEHKGTRCTVSQDVMSVYTVQRLRPPLVGCLTGLSRTLTFYPTVPQATIAICLHHCPLSHTHNVSMTTLHTARISADNPLKRWVLHFNPFCPTSLSCCVQCTLLPPVMRTRWWFTYVWAESNKYLNKSLGSFPITSSVDLFRPMTHWLCCIVSRAVT